mmetsp:Transcript_7279/g.21445  ORF Transcript_7279/g.21445 Transcript_7279/m.21445 type:complete len:219 (+) Transcript_7279:1618-2274(+)
MRLCRRDWRRRHLRWLHLLAPSAQRTGSQGYRAPTPLWTICTLNHSTAHVSKEDGDPWLRWHDPSLTPVSELHWKALCSCHNREVRQRAQQPHATGCMLRLVQLMLGRRDVLQSYGPLSKTGARQQGRRLPKNCSSRWQLSEMSRLRHRQKERCWLRAWLLHWPPKHQSCRSSLATLLVGRAQLVCHIWHLQGQVCCKEAHPGSTMGKSVRSRMHCAV